MPTKHVVVKSKYRLRTKGSSDPCGIVGNPYRSHGECKIHEKNRMIKTMSAKSRMRRFESMSQWSNKESVKDLKASGPRRRFHMRQYY